MKIKKEKRTPEWGGVALSSVQMPIVMALSAGGKIEKVLHHDVKKGSRYAIEHPVSHELIFIANTTVGALKKKGIINDNLEFPQGRLPGVE